MTISEIRTEIFEIGTISMAWLFDFSRRDNMPKNYLVVHHTNSSESQILYIEPDLNIYARADSMPHVSFVDADTTYIQDFRRYGIILSGYHSIPEQSCNALVVRVDEQVELEGSAEYNNFVWISSDVVLGFQYCDGNYTGKAWRGDTGNSLNRGSKLSISKNDPRFSGSASVPGNLKFDHRGGTVILASNDSPCYIVKSDDLLPNLLLRNHIALGGTGPAASVVHCLADNVSIFTNEHSHKVMRLRTIDKCSMVRDWPYRETDVNGYDYTSIRKQTRQIRKLESLYTIPGNDKIHASTTGRVFITVSQNTIVECIHPLTTRIYWRLVFGESVTSIAFCPEDLYVAITCSTTLNIIKLSTGKIVAKQELPCEGIKLAWHPHSIYLTVTDGLSCIVNCVVGDEGSWTDFKNVSSVLDSRLHDNDSK